MNIYIERELEHQEFCIRRYKDKKKEKKREKKKKEEKKIEERRGNLLTFHIMIAGVCADCICTT